MSCSQSKSQITVIADSTIVLLAQVLDTAGNYVTQADVDSISVVINDMSEVTPEQVGETDEPNVSDVISDTLLTDDRWTKDSIGYNVMYSVAMPERDTTYEVRITLTMGSGDTHVILYENIKAK